MDNFQIGKTKLSENFQPTQWFNLEAGDNLYRILPPVHSLAVEGKYAKFYAYHGGFKNSRGVTCHFQCIEETDRKTKVIKVRCPVCDMVRERRAQYDLAKKQGQHAAEQLDEFFNKFIYPFQAKKKYFVNAINANGDIGVLQIPYKLFGSIHAFFKDLEKKRNFDPTGYNGVYLKMAKRQRFPGDRDTTYSVDLAIEQDPTNPQSLRYKFHELTPAIIENMRTQTRDLNDLFKLITAEQMALLAASNGDEQVTAVDKIFARPERNENPESYLESTIPGTTAKAVSQVELTPNGVSVRQPNFPSSAEGFSAPSITPFVSPTAPAAASAPMIAPSTVTTPPLAPAVNPALTSTQPHTMAPNLAPLSTSQPMTALSDAEFLAKFMPSKA
jgi:hypothetical protein